MRNFFSDLATPLQYLNNSDCLPDGCVHVTNPNPGLYSHVFAVQNEGVSAAVKCSVSTTGVISNITGCAQVRQTYRYYYKTS